MAASLLIIVFSFVLLIYWFRSTCILLLQNQTSVAPLPNSRFGVDVILDKLKKHEPLEPLHETLSRDYQVFIYLVEHASGLSLDAFEDRLLLVDYRLMQWWYSATRIVLPNQARRALSEMASVLTVLVRKVDQQAGVSAEA